MGYAFCTRAHTHRETNFWAHAHTHNHELGCLSQLNSVARRPTKKASCQQLPCRQKGGEIDFDWPFLGGGSRGSAFARVRNQCSWKGGGEVRVFLVGRGPLEGGGAGRAFLGEGGVIHLQTETEGPTSLEIFTGEFRSTKIDPNRSKTIKVDQE